MAFLTALLSLCYLVLLPQSARSVSPNAITQITFGFNADVAAGSISGNGSLLAFRSAADLLGLNPDHTQEVFLINADGTGLRQLTEGLGGFGSFNPTITGDGKTIAFQSNLNSRRRNRDESTEIFTISSRGTG
jgi:Tol biopolymer transport system component